MSALAETLQQEHVKISDSLDLVGALVEVLDRGDVPPEEDLYALLDFMEKFTDQTHRAREEVVFAELARTSDVSVRPLIHRLEVEHARTRKIVSALRALVPHVEAGDRRAESDFAMYLRSYRMRTRDHIRDEAREFMPLVGSTTRSLGRERTVRTFEGTEKQDAEEQASDRLQETIRRLSSKYSTRPPRAA